MPYKLKYKTLLGDGVWNKKKRGLMFLSIRSKYLFIFFLFQAMSPNNGVVMRMEYHPYMESDVNWNWTGLWYSFIANIKL